MATYQINLTTYKDRGFRCNFPYDKATIAQLKLCLGVIWDKSLRSWVAEAPEVLLDMARFGIDYSFGDDEAANRATKFLAQIDRIIALKELENGVDGEQYSFQRIGTELLLEQISGILGDDMGLGKTKQTIDACIKAGAKDVLCVVLNTTTYKWRDEVLKWYPDAVAYVIPNDATERSAAIDILTGPRGRDSVRFIIVNYEKLWRPWWPQEKKWDVLIFDEATKVKNRKTQTHKAMLAIAANSLMVFAITGTPLETKPDDLHGVFSVTRPSVFGGISRFKEQHVEEETVDGRSVKKFINKDLLRERFSPWFTRRTKAQVQTQIPPKLYTQVHFDLSEPEMAVYDQLADDADDWLGSADALIRQLRFQQLTSSPYLVDRPDLGRGAKYEMLEAVLEPWEGRVLIFTRFKTMADYLAEWLSPEWFHPEALITGGIKEPEERLRRLNAFNRGELGRVFIGTDALSHGMDVAADLVIHYDKLWNPAKEWQREDRCHGIGRGIEGKTTNVVHLLANKTLDVGMQYVTDYRASVIHEVIGEADSVMLRQFSAMDYRSLIRGRIPALEETR